MELPKDEGQPILAKIKYVNDLGTAIYFEVVYFIPDVGWRAYSGSKTFQDGEQVIAWAYISETEQALDSHSLLRK